MKEKFDRYLEFIKHLPAESDDAALISLKGHLLSEIEIREYIYRRVLHPERLASKQINFSTLIDFASSLEDNNKINWIWKALKKLNSIRNSLAHNLVPTDFLTMENDFIDFVNCNDGNLESIALDSKALKYGKFPLAIFQVYDALINAQDKSENSRNPSPIIEITLKALGQLDAEITQKKSSK